MTSTLPLSRPSKDIVANMPPFEGLPANNIHIVKNATEVDFALSTISEARFIGFDTESKPEWVKETSREGPHVIQFSTLNHVFIVQVGSSAPIDFIKTVLESSVIVKVGFGLKSDREPLRRKLGIRLVETVDLSQAFRKLGYRQTVGIKAAVAIILGRKLQKSKSITTSNWALPILSQKQLLYAAEDAYAALAVFHAMGMPYMPNASVGSNIAVEGRTNKNLL